MKIGRLWLMWILCALLVSVPVTKAAAKTADPAAGRDNFEEDPEWGRAREKGYSLSVRDSVSGYSHNSRFRNGYNIKTGVDVSRYQGSIDWNRARADGVEFAIIRAAYRGYGDAGTLNPDPSFEANINGALSAGLPVGVYIFSQAITVQEARDEANYVMSMVNGYHLSLPIVMDYEYVGTAGRLYNAHLSVAQATDICREFCRTVEERGYQAMVYANKNMLQYSLNAAAIASSYQIWLANYTYQTEYSGEYTYWQFTSSGTVDGINGSVDMNFWYDRIPTTYTVKFDGNGATKGKMKKATGCKYGVDYRLTKNAFEKKGYEFTGWNTKKNGKGDSYKDRAIVKNLSAKDKAVVTLYAQWKLARYKIQYVLNGGKNSGDNPKNYTVKTAKIKLKEPTRKGYLFEGWYSNAACTKKVSAIPKGSTGNKKLYAKWTPIRYTIIYNGNGATEGSMKKQTGRKYGKTYTLAENQFEKDGYVFVGWNTKADGSGRDFEPEEEVKNLKYKDNSSITLYAQWVDEDEYEEEEEEEEEEDDEEDEEEEDDEDSGEEETEG